MKRLGLILLRLLFPVLIGWIFLFAIVTIVGYILSLPIWIVTGKTAREQKEFLLTNRFISEVFDSLDDFTNSWMLLVFNTTLD